MTQNALFGKLVSGSFLVAGMVLLIATSAQTMHAESLEKLSNDGAQIIALDYSRGIDTSVQHTLRPAAPHVITSTSTTGSTVQIILGMLLVLIGFCIHALLIMRNERPVPVRIVNTDKSRETGSVIRRALEVYWVEKRK